MLKAIAKENGKDWKAIFKTQEQCAGLKSQLTQSLKNNGISLSSSLDLVVFGSFARLECSGTSDIDWTLLINGPADTQHFDLGQLIQTTIQHFENAEPGFTGMFGQLTFSHDLIHFIGGQEDTNHNLTRRVLMLLDSSHLDLQNDPRSAYENVLAGIIDQYINNDSGYDLKHENESKVPRVLLNDLIRFWRTMCVDFAYKQRQPKGKKWALRNIKLRMSRKLIFIKGLLMCYNCYAKGLNQVQTKEYLKKVVLEKNPLQYIAEVLHANQINDQLIVGLIDAYERYLNLISNADVRNEWEQTSMKELEDLDSFVQAKSISRDFQNYAQAIFFEADQNLSAFTKKYGTF